jgi:hypothetical protein
MSVPDLVASLSELLLEPDEAVELKAAGGVEAAVLIPIYAGASGLVAVFTERRADLRRHAGEVSFPGGRRDPGRTCERRRFARQRRRSASSLSSSPSSVRCRRRRRS